MFSANDLISLGAGSLVCLLPTWVLYRCVVGRPRAPRAVLQSLYWGEALKFALTGLGFTAFFQWPGLSPALVLAGFVMAQSTCLLLPLIMRRPTLRKQRF